MRITTAQYIYCLLITTHCRKAKTESTKKWLSKLKGHENVPVLVCLTFGDELYSEIAKKLCGRMTSTFPQRTDVEPLLKAERQVHAVVHVRVLYILSLLICVYWKDTFYAGNY